MSIKEIFGIISAILFGSGALVIFIALILLFVWIILPPKKNKHRK